LRLERLRHGRFDHRGGCTGIARGYLHARRHDVRKLRDGNARQRDRSGKGDDDSDNNC